MSSPPPVLAEGRAAAVATLVPLSPVLADRRAASSTNLTAPWIRSSSARHLQISTWVSFQKLRLISAAVRVNMQFLCCWRLRNQHELGALLRRTSCTESTSRRLGSPTAFSSSTTSSQRIKCSTCASKSVLHWKTSRWERRSASWARSCFYAYQCEV